MNFTKLFFLLMIAMVFPAVGTPQNDSDIQPLTILTHNCAGCHNTADHPGALFLNKARLTEPETVSLMIKMIETSQMPPAHKDFKKSKDGKKLLRWLKQQKKSLNK